MNYEWLTPKVRLVSERDALAARCGELEQDLALARAECELLRQSVPDSEHGSLEHLLARVAELQAENDRLRVAASSGGLEELLRERETNRRLAEDNLQLKAINRAADPGWP